MSDELVMLKIGDVHLGMRGAAYDEFVHEVAAEWASQGRINRRNALQHTGIGPEKITLNGTIHPLFFGLGIGTLKGLQAMVVAGTPQPHMVIDGTGRRYGYFIVRSVRETRSKFLTNGAPQKQGFTVELERYGEDSLREDAISGEGNTDLNALRPGNFTPGGLGA